MCLITLGLVKKSIEQNFGVKLLWGVMHGWAIRLTDLPQTSDKWMWGNVTRDAIGNVEDPLHREIVIHLVQGVE